MIDIVGLKKNVGFLNWVAAAATLALIWLYFHLSGLIETRFDKADERMRDVQIEASRQYGAIDGMQQGIRRIEEKLDGDQPETSNRAR